MIVKVNVTHHFADFVKKLYERYVEKHYACKNISAENNLIYLKILM